jgi:pimeloyl-ACP methyl ester carboxylesterase
MAWGRLQVWEGGRGDVGLLAIHGLGGSGRYWAGIEDDLGDRCSIVAPDLAGFGGSSRPRAHTDRTLHLDTLDALTAGDRPWIVLGHSLGGVLGMLWAGRRRRDVAGLAMVASPYPTPQPRWDPATWRGPRAALPRTVAGLARVSWPILSLPAQILAPYPAPVVRDFGRQSFAARAWTLWSLWSDPSLEADVRSSAASLPPDLPILLRHAADDRSIPPADLDRWSALLPRADAAHLPSGGHQVLLRVGFDAVIPWLRDRAVRGRG